MCILESEAKQLRTGRAEVLAKQEVGERAFPVTDRLDLLDFGEGKQHRGDGSGRIIVHRKN